MPRLTAPLDGILGTRPAVAILRALHGRRDGISARELARQTGFSHPTILQALDALVSQGVVLQADAGRQRLSRLNTRHELVRSLVPKLFDAEWRWRDQIIGLLRDALAPAGPETAAYIFGSMARGDDTPASDLDLLILVPDRVSVDRVRSALTDAAPTLRTRFGLRLAPIVLVLRDARRRAKRGDALLTGASRDARTVVGRRDLAELLA